MSFRTAFIAASIAIASVPAAFAGPLSADGSPLTLDTTVASQASREHVRSTVQAGAARSSALVSADGAPLILSLESATGLTRAQVQSEARQSRTTQDAHSLPLIGQNG